MNEKRGRWSWPLAFFMLNLAAVAAGLWLLAGTGARDLEVTGMTPSGTAVNPDTLKEVRLEFNHRLDPDSVSEHSVRFAPPVAGRCELADSGTALRFHAREPFRPATTYMVVVAPSLRGSRGEPPPKELLEFSTTRFRLESAAQVGYSRDAYTVEMTFNQPIAASDLEKALAVRTTRHWDGTDAGRVKVVGNANARRHQLRIEETDPCFLLLSLSAGTTGASGPLGLEKEERLLWRIGSPGTTPDWAAGLKAEQLRGTVEFLGMTCDWEGSVGAVRVRTTSPVELDRLREFVTVEPEVPVTFSSTWNGFRILGDFQPGRQYRVTLRDGLPAGYAGQLEKTVTRQVWFDDYPESLAFSHGGGFLSPDGLLKVAVKSRNLDKFNLGVRRLYASNLVEALLRDYAAVEAEYAEPEMTVSLKTGGVRNRETETILDLRDLLDGAGVGVYGLEIWNEARWRSREAVVTVSDLGLSARLGRKRLVAWTTSIREGAPRAGVAVSVFSNKRQLLGRAASDDDGVASVDLPPLPPGEQPALVVGEADNGEFSFVRLVADRRSRSRDSGRGATYIKEYEVFLACERGVYRGGEKVELTGLVRDAQLHAVPELPVEIRLYGPDRKQLAKNMVEADSVGRLAFTASLGQSYPGGLYTLEARLPGQDDVLGSTMFRIADYLPDTLSVAMEYRDTPDEPEPHPDHSLLIRVARLAGGGVAGLPVRMMAQYSPAPFAPKGWDGWRFGDARISANQAERRERALTLAADGETVAEWDDPRLNFPAAARMRVRVEAAEGGGRAVSAVSERILHQTPYYTGVETERRNAVAGETLALPLAAVAPDGDVYPASGEWKGALYRVEYAGVMRKTSDDRLVYDWVRKELHEEDLAGTWENGLSRVVSTPKAGGAYRLVVEGGEGKGCVWDFYAEGPGATWHGEDPETLTLNLDREAYPVGGTARVSVSAPFAGKALVVVERDEVLSHEIMDFTEGNNEFAIPVTEAMRPNAYLGVTLVRPARAEAEWKPHRLSGVAAIAVDNTDRRLKVGLEVPETPRPGAKVRATVTVTRGDEAVPDAPVVIWAVDAGILSLTDYAAPSPWDAFYRRRRVGVEEADMFSRLAPELSEWIAKEASPGGDGVDPYADTSRRLNPIFANRVRAAVLLDANLTTDTNGVATAELDIPEFAGTLRFMCWVASERDMGAADLEVEVKAPISVTAAWPRFASPGDSFLVPLTVINRSGRNGVARVACEADPGLRLEPATMEIELADNEARLVHIRATSLRAGVVKAVVTASLNGDAFADRVELSSRPPVLFAREAGTILVKPGEKATRTLGEGLLPENSRVKLVAGGSPLIQLSGSLEYLLDYPYGCAEQTASRLLALTFLPDLVALSRPGQIESGEVAVLAAACMERLQMMQNGNGSLRMWPGEGQGLYWVSAHTLFTLMESRSAGNPAPERLVEELAQYLDRNLEPRLSAEALDSEGGETAALACLALAKADRLKKSWLFRLEEVAREREGGAKPLSSAALAHLANAVAVAGDREAGLALYRRYFPEGEHAGRSFNSTVEKAAWLMAAMAVGAGEDEQALLAAHLAHRAEAGYTHWSTRENSLVLAALGRYWQLLGPASDTKANLGVGAGASEEFSTRGGKAWEGLAAGTEIAVENTGEGDLRLFWLAEGVPLSGEATEEDRGLTARRRVFDAAGKELKAPYALRRGDVYEIRLRLTGKADDLVIADLLPAGLEIEDANLKGRQLEKNSAKGLAVKNVEIKDDRLLVFASLFQEGEYRYLARAVTAGDFVWPALDASRMYDASTRSVHGRCDLNVGGGKEGANDR